MRRPPLVVPDPVPGQMTLTYGMLSAAERGEVAQPRSGDVRDDEVGERLAAMRDRLRTTGRGCG